MPGVSTLVFAKFYDQGHIEPRCVDCGETFGTFSFEVLQRSIMSNLGRGGLKCPTCRKMSCFFCGLPWINGGHKRLRVIDEDGVAHPEIKAVCVLCSIECEERVRELW